MKINIFLYKIYNKCCKIKKLIKEGERLWFKKGQKII